MKAYLLDLVRTSPSPLQARNQVREYIQARVLECLQRAGAMIPLAFHGGTALRFLYTIPRYSEDLDFALEQAHSQYDLRAWLRNIQSQLAAEGYAVEVKLNDQKTVHSAWVRLPGLLHELTLSPHRDEILAVKLEVDTHPPVGATLATTVVRRHVILQLQHHDRASLLAGKLHALLQRPYLKGRDVYDLLWYLGDPAWPTPNLTLLNNALRQTGWDQPPLTEHTWRQVLVDRLQTQDWAQVVADVRPFLSPEADPNLLTLENVLKVVEQK